MDLIAKAMTDQEIRDVAQYFASLKPRQFTTVREAATVPKTFVGQGRMRFVDPAGGTEPIGKRIITVPEDAERARRRDPHSGFIAYVPPGSIARGRTLAAGGAKTTNCTICHGEGLRGLGNVPRLAGCSDLCRAAADSLQRRHAQRGGRRADEETTVGLTTTTSSICPRTSVRWRDPNPDTRARSGRRSSPSRTSTRLWTRRHPRTLRRARRLAAGR